MLKVSTAKRILNLIQIKFCKKESDKFVYFNNRKKQIKINFCGGII